MKLTKKQNQLIRDIKFYFSKTNSREFCLTTIWDWSEISHRSIGGILGNLSKKGIIDIVDTKHGKIYKLSDDRGLL